MRMIRIRRGGGGFFEIGDGALSHDTPQKFLKRNFLIFSKAPSKNFLIFS